MTLSIQENHTTLPPPPPIHIVPTPHYTPFPTHCAGTSSYSNTLCQHHITPHVYASSLTVSNNNGQPYCIPASHYPHCIFLWFRSHHTTLPPYLLQLPITLHILLLTPSHPAYPHHTTLYHHTKPCNHCTTRLCNKVFKIYSGDNKRGTELAYTLTRMEISP